MRNVTVTISYYDIDSPEKYVFNIPTKVKERAKKQQLKLNIPNLADISKDNQPVSDF